MLVHFSLCGNNATWRCGPGHPPCALRYSDLDCTYLALHKDSKVTECTRMRESGPDQDDRTLLAQVSRHLRIISHQSYCRCDVEHLQFSHHTSDLMA